MTERREAAGRDRADSLVWLDRLKGIAFVWIFLNHVVERIAGGAYANNPTFDWPPLAVRLAQFAPVRAGLASWPLTLVRDAGWYGDVGVTLFVIASGFGLTYGALAKREAKLDVGAFYRRRALRILPLWWAAHVLFLPLGLLKNGSLSTGDWRFYADLAGLRFLPGMFYYFSPAWWYVGLILQLYLVFPLLFAALRRYGALALVIGGSVLGFIALALGPSMFPNTYLDAWQRGAFFITRLPEFVVGMALARLWFDRPAIVAACLRSPASWVAGLVAYAAGTALSFTLPGMIFAPLLLGAGAFIAVLPMAFAGGDRAGALAWTGRRSYALYLTHHPFVLAFVPASGTAARLAFGIVGALLGTAATAAILERLTAWIEAAVARVARARGPAVAAGVVLAGLATVVAVPVLADVAVTTYDPQEVNGWGERASLDPDERFGWKLIPSRTTRLRWESYDYRVTSNALGFPGPAFSPAKPPHTLRILVTGDAFASAEGVDTDQAFPRLLAPALERVDRKRNVEIMNFAITGYGPNEEAAVVRAFAPAYRPDVILIEYFANDVEDALTSDDAFRASIGFARPPQTGAEAVFGLAQLLAWLHLRITEPLASRIKHRPDPEGYFLGNFRFMERGRADYDGPGVRVSVQRYRETAAIARSIGARLVVAAIPPPAAVCDARSLRYYPHNVDLSDATRYDRALPDRRIERIASAAGVTLWNLSADLRALPACPYMPRNMHFTRDGHRAVADDLARHLSSLR